MTDEERALEVVCRQAWKDFDEAGVTDETRAFRRDGIRWHVNAGGTRRREYDAVLAALQAVRAECAHCAEAVEAQYLALAEQLDAAGHARTADKALACAEAAQQVNAKIREGEP